MATEVDGRTGAHRRRWPVLDKLVVASHDQELAGRALAAALDSEVGYIGALGSRRTQQARADWLAYRGDHRPRAASTARPGSTSAPTRRPRSRVSIVAEALAVQAGVDAATDPAPDASYAGA